MKPALIVLLTAVALAAAGCGSSMHVTGEPRPDPHGPQLAGQVLVESDSSGAVRICGSQVSDLMFGPPACVGGPQATGIDPDKLPDHSAKPAVRWGYLYVVGRYRSGTFSVDSYRLHGPPNRLVGGHFNIPPCVPPARGWVTATPTQSQRATVDHYSKLAHHHDLVDIAYFRRGSVLTVASSNPARTRRVLAKYWPRQLCVVSARYPRSLVTREGTRMVNLMKFHGGATYGWPTGAGGTTVNRLGQPMTTLEVLLVTPQLRAYLAKQPPGLVQVQATLTILPRL